VLNLVEILRRAGILEKAFFVSVADIPSNFSWAVFSFLKKSTPNIVQFYRFPYNKLRCLPGGDVAMTALAATITVRRNASIFFYYVAVRLMLLVDADCIYSGVAFLTFHGVLFTPVYHRFMHKFYLQLED
jgi:hypothetical protein